MNKPRFKLRPNGTWVNLTMTERHGNTHGNCLFTDEQVAEIRREYRQPGASIRTIARKFGACKSTIGNIVANDTYKDEAHGAH